LYSFPIRFMRVSLFYMSHPPLRLSHSFTLPHFRHCWALTPLFLSHSYLFLFFFWSSPHIPFLSVSCIFYFPVFYQWQNAACVCSVSWQWYWVCIKHDRNLLSYVFNLYECMNIIWFLSLAKLYIMSCWIVSIIRICIVLGYECYATMGHSAFVIFRILPPVIPKCLWCVCSGSDTSKFCVRTL